MAMLDVVHHHKENRFEVRCGQALAVAEYQRKGQILALVHTLVPPAFRGQGIAGKLAQAAFDYARAEQLQVYPACSFMLAWVKQHEDAQALLSPAGKKLLTEAA